MDLKLSLKMSQRLVLTPTLQQAIKLLQYSRQELVQYVHQELLENPTLEEAPPSDSQPEEQPPEPEAVEDREGADATDGMDGEGDLDWSNYLSEFDNGYEPYQPKERTSFENILASGTTLQEHLSQQLNITLEDGLEKEVAFEIVGNIDDNGYLQASVEELAEHLEESVEKVEGVLAKIQEFDPPGVAARSLSECLALQLIHQGLEGELEEMIVRKHLKDLEARRLKAIARAEKVSLEEVKDAARMIATLEPHPGCTFTQERVEYVVPDLKIEKVGGEYHVQLIEEGLPQLRLNRFYRKLYRSRKLSSTDKEFLDRKVNSARWLIKSILQRQQTILKVARSIVVFQKDFFDHGVSCLKPLVLRTVAEDIGMHESTVSRVTSKKYAQTPQGILELKYFFSSGINRSGADSMSSVTVMDIIRKIISEEDTSKPLSDIEIAARLKGEHSLNIARRTVAKYRGLMKIMPASRRRQSY